MERKVFYVLISKRESMGVEKKDGYEFEIHNKKLYGYISNEHCKAYIIDPETGRSIYSYPIDDECREIESMEYAIDRMMEDEYTLEAYEIKKNSAQYELMKEIFNNFLHGVALEKSQKQNKS